MGSAPKRLDRRRGRCYSNYAITGGTWMKFMKRVGARIKGFGGLMVAIPKDIRRYLAIRRM